MQQSGKEKTHFEFCSSEQSVAGRFLHRFVSLPQSWLVRRKLVLQFPDSFFSVVQPREWWGAITFSLWRPSALFFTLPFLSSQLMAGRPNPVTTNLALNSVLFSDSRSQKSGTIEKVVSWSPADKLKADKIRVVLFEKETLTRVGEDC